ncbi:hypothetical protein THIOM_002153 [Candidatus Thiomargarita nelsonii]|uniref:Uncharacterized protein n=1 Tax=Candidatus Thiomargarita nelsonii TaxID=1003181 RepID=A0A176S1Y7_9GAMM|nr:hypothetical protein THIOM_002153 [Candidatus Thiomargarita nelsonii]
MILQRVENFCLNFLGVIILLLLRKNKHHLSKTHVFRWQDINRLLPNLPKPFSLIPLNLCCRLILKAIKKKPRCLNWQHS